MRLLLCFPVAPKLEVDGRYGGVQQIKGGTRMSLTASMSGVPQPTARWFHNGNELRTNDNVTVETGKNYATLHVAKANKDFAGQFKVIAENSVGSDSKEFTAEIKG